MHSDVFICLQVSKKVHGLNGHPAQKHVTLEHKLVADITKHFRKLSMKSSIATLNTVQVFEMYIYVHI